MTKLRIIRASAGSGKTYRITADYLRLLFRYPNNYKHILAVTFTNKATEEMKSRIISELFNLAEGKHSNHSESLQKEFRLSQQQISQKARTILDNILHNYSRFSVNTIDSFFQRIIKSFAREAGLQFNYDVALDTEEILEHASDRMLLKIDEDKELLEWMVQFAEKRIEDGKSWDFKKDMLKLGKELFNEKFMSFPKEFHQKLADREALKEFHLKLFELKAAFEKNIKNFAAEGVKLIENNGLQACDFKYGERGGIGQYFYILSTGEIKYPSDRNIEAAKSVETWLPSDKEKARLLQNVADAGLFNLLKQIINHFLENYTIYNSSCEVLAGFYTLGLMSDLSAEVSDYASENNVFILAGTGPFLKSIIGENDAPFIYEKTGQFTRYFMIDEFQDTSGIQWHNFKPLVNNSLSEGNECMVVGDIKQSIYRWRNSDWKVMASQLEEEMDVQFDDLGFNWRSKFNIIAFNNTLFFQSSDVLQDALNQALEKKCYVFDDSLLKNIIQSAYKSNMQKVPSGRKPNEGYVNIEFLKNDDKDWKNEVLEKLPGIIENLVQNGHKMKDIAILVRTTSEGAEIAEFLNSYEKGNLKLQVLSNESSFLKNSAAIGFLIKALKYLVLPEDAVNLAAMVSDYLLSVNIAAGEQNRISEVFSSSGEMVNYIEKLPVEFTGNVETFSHMPLESLFERLIEIFELNKNENNLPFIQAFHDVIMDYLKNNTSNLEEFLNMWEDKKNSLSVSISEDQDAVRVLTIHKSKGLEFSNVIIPFCNWSIDHAWPNTPVMWCESSVSIFGFLQFLPVKYSNSLSDTVFAPQYFTEKAQVYVDNLNLLYVAFTRSTDNLFAFAPIPAKEENLGTTGDLLYRCVKNSSSIQNRDFPIINNSDFWNEETKAFELGNLISPRKIDTADTNDIKLESYRCDSIKQKLRQKNSNKAFWEAEEKHTVTSRSYGNVMHRLFQNISVSQDVEKAIDLLVFNGLLKEEERSKISAEIKGLLSQKPFEDWFNGEWQVINESVILVPGAHAYRPDRVMIKAKDAIVVDYKFGNIQNIKYNSQVNKYMDFLKEMGYKKVEGFVWYVNMDLLERIN
jgi:ATP-dependent exoDNAse (exonuclease V) beta subunit